MKNKAFFKIILSGVTMLFISLFSMCIPAYGDQNMGSVPQDTYQLRVNGKADQAREMLQQHLKRDSTDASAWFELARTGHHIFLGQGQFAAEEWNEVKGMAKKAVKYAPENEVYAYYYAYCSFFDAFISMMRQQADVTEKITIACDAFNAVLAVNPRCYEAKLYLIDIYGLLPAEMGGDRAKAEVIAGDMKTGDRTYYAMAQAKLMPDTSDMVLYWQKVGQETGMNAGVMEELGRAYLLKSDSENGTDYFKKAIEADHSRSHLTMNLVRYHLMSAQQDPATKEAHLKIANDLANEYLKTCADSVASLKAYTLSTLAMISMFAGNQDAGDAYREQANAIDPYYSKASGMAPDMLYCAPDKVKIQYSSFFMPF